MDTNIPESAQIEECWDAGSFHLMVYYSYPMYMGQVWQGKELVFETYGQPYKPSSYIVDELELWAKANEPKLRVYTFVFEGVWRNAIKVVLAYSEPEAIKLAGLENTKYDLTIADIGTKVIYEFDGDY